MNRRSIERSLKDFDHDGPGDMPRGARDNDDNAILASFGHATSTAEARKITAVVKRYYAIARSGDSRKACAMFPSSVKRRIALDFGRFGFHYARKAKTCSETMSLIFGHLRQTFSAPIAVLNVITKGKNAYALIASTAVHAELLTLQRSGGGWRVAQPLGGDLW